MLIQIVAQAVRGFLMGAADIVPGVSGGTVALVLGIYNRLIDAVRTGSSALGRFVRADIKGGIELLRSVDWLFLIPLGAGIGAAVLALSHTIETLLEEQPVNMAALFFGLVVGSIAIASSLVQGWDAQRAAILVGVAVVAFFVLGQRSGPVEDPALWMFFASGAVAICAMILPGVSGSFLLLMLGMYDTLLAAVTDRDLPALGVFMVGAVVGLALFSQALHWGLVNHEKTVLAGLIGLMVGSLRVLWPWPDGTDSTAMTGPQGDWWVAVGFAVLGAVAVVVITKVAERFEGRTAADLTDELETP